MSAYNRDRGSLYNSDGESKCVPALGNKVAELITEGTDNPELHGQTSSFKCYCWLRRRAEL